LKGLITNTTLSKSKAILQAIMACGKGFLISKTDLRIRPVYHRLIKRIDKLDIGFKKTKNLKTKILEPNDIQSEILKMKI
jgi:hypothetical protein